MKAVGTGWARGVRWVDVETCEVEEAGMRRLRLELHGRVAELAGDLESVGGSQATRLHLAVGRSRTHAIALVMFERTFEPALESEPAPAPEPAGGQRP